MFVFHSVPADTCWVFFGFACMTGVSVLLLCCRLYLPVGLAVLLAFISLWGLRFAGGTVSLSLFLG